MARECWFCGRDAPERWRDRVIGFHRGVDHAMTPLIVVLRTTWERETVLVPRCARCHGGHRIEQAAMAVAIAAVLAYAASGQLDVLLGFRPSPPGGTVLAAVLAGVACVPALVWIAVRQAWPPMERLAPRRLRYARRHPEVLRLRDDGWRFRPGPFPHWLNPEGSYPAPPPTRRRRMGGAVLGFLGLGCAVATVVLYLWGYTELAGGCVLAGCGLFFLSSKLDPEP